ncbi:tripartite tricarboxylate transporter substrate binding protein [Pigmentiphaga sp. H8]|uniref:Bug family tripartite tricarboxylate transporter substrate binding protein n=1 Tax=unclassified Pigmentiphaga TaxID=2626614 RepID=UPI000F59D91C|nr:tripartite tricarboxylate transporter substrate binding protein [Pigmentiphaga sp. H8]AZG11089.1 tripartite tricarboxylate transporter substrate binding protein [Pigmentiphaga sp. H8]
MNPQRRDLFKWAALAGAATVLPGRVLAEAAYPARPVRLVIPFTAGSTTDVIGRLLSDRLQQSLGQPVIVDNRPGAGGTIGATQVAAAQPDGYTALIHSAGHVANAALYPGLKYDTIKDFIPVTMLASMPNVIVVAPDKGFRSLRDLVDKARAAPGKFMYGSSGNGSASHIAGEKFRIATGITVTHVPYKGTPQALTDVMSGLLDWFVAPLAVAVPFIRDKRLAPLAIGAPRRSPVLPDVPTTTEAGFADADHRFWVGLFLPARTPGPVVARLHDDTVRSLGADDVRGRIEALGAEPAPMAQAQFAGFVQDEAVATTQLIRQAGIKADA